MTIGKAIGLCILVLGTMLIGEIPAIALVLRGAELSARRLGLLDGHSPWTWTDTLSLALGAVLLGVTLARVL